MHKSSLKNPRVIKFRIDRVLLDGKDGRDELIGAMRDYGWAAARMHRHWIMYHEQAGTPAKIRSGQKTGPAFPAEIKAELYRVGTQAVPHINPTSIQWLNQWLMRTVNEQTSAKHNRKKWVAIINGDEDQSAFDRLPLRVYDSFAAVEVDGEDIWLKAKLLKNAEGKYRDLKLRMVRPKLADSAGKADYQAKREFLRMLAAGATGAAGYNRMPCSQILWQRGQFYFSLTIDRPLELPKLDHRKHLILRTSRHAMWEAELNGNVVLIGQDRLLSVAEARAKRKRSKRNRSGWMNFCKTLNRQIAHEISEKIAEYGVGKVTIDDGPLDSAVNVAGKDGYDPTSFPVQQARVFLRQKLEPLGVEVVERANLRSVKRRIADGRKELDEEAVREAVG